MSQTVIAGLIGAVGGAAVMIVALPSVLFGRVPVLSAILDADSPQVAVVDGGTLRLHDTVIRLQGIDAPARGQSCNGIGGSYDCGAAAAEALAGLVRGHPVTCRLAGRDPAGFPQGRCESAGTDVNRALIATGWARVSADDADLADAEVAARSRRLGLWRDGGDPPAF
jgi:endonuclease YncB( thermonuclease family)